MFSRHQILYLLILCLLMQNVLSQEVADFAEEYIDEDLPESSVAEEEQTAGAKPSNDTNDTNDKNQKKTQHFSEDRFTKLFQPRNRNKVNQPSQLLPKFAAKPKPTLPSFIKRTPPLIKVTPSTPSPAQNQRFNQRATVSTTLRTTTTRTPSRNAINGNNRRNQINNNLNNNNRSPVQSTPSPTTTDSSARRRFGSGNRRFNANATIPATTSRPRRS